MWALTRFAAHIRHAHVGDDNISGIFFKALERLFTRGGEGRREVLVAAEQLEEVAGTRVIVRDEKAHCPNFASDGAWLNL